MRMLPKSTIVTSSQRITRAARWGLIAAFLVGVTISLAACSDTAGEPASPIAVGVPPTATVAATNVSAIATSTATSVPPPTAITTATSVPPTAIATATSVPPTATTIRVPATATATSEAPTATATAAATNVPVTPTVGLILKRPGASDGYTLFNLRRGREIYLIDNLGRVVHKWTLESPTVFAKLMESGNLLVMGAVELAFDGVREVDPDGNIVWEYYLEGQHHDFLKLPNGNVLLLASDTRSAEEAIDAGLNPDYATENFRMTHLVEVEPTGPTSGRVVWEWSGWDHLVQDYDPDKLNYGVVADHPELIDVNYDVASLGKFFNPWDRMHTNAVAYNAELDQIMLSPRQYSEIWIIDHSTTTEEAAGHTGGNGGKGGDLLYRWGNPRVYGAGTLDDQQLFGQHNPYWIEPGLSSEGNILVFNNGFGLRLRPDGAYSSVEEIVPPIEKGGGYGYRLDAGSAYVPAEPVWTYTAAEPTDWFAPFLSGAQRLPNGNTLICDGTHGTLFEVTPEGETVWKYINPLVPRDAPLRQGEPVPVIELIVDNEGRTLPIGEVLSDGDVWENQVFRVHHYARDYPGLRALDLTPGDPIELYD